MKSGRFWAWVVFVLGAAYFFIPLIATIEFSLRMRRGVYSLDAYKVVLGDSQFQATFMFSAVVAIFTILLGVLIVVPTA
ncbi:MAG: ABC transporter permease, partial [Mesorhizobium sp.]